MSYQFHRFRGPSPDEGYIEYLLQDELTVRSAALDRLWRYYRNEISGLAGFAGFATFAAGAGATSAEDRPRPYQQDQEFGLPARITGRLGSLGGEAPRRKEVVIENDIGWRIDTGVHFLFGKAPLLESLAPDASRARLIESVLGKIYQHSGGLAMLQEVALLGSVYGYADLVIRIDAGLQRCDDGSWLKNVGGGQLAPADPLQHLRIEAIEAPRAIAVLDEDDYRRLAFYVLHYHKPLNRLGGIAAGAGAAGTMNHDASQPAAVQVTEILGPQGWQYYEDGDLVAEGENLLGEVPVVHIQNLPVPGSYEGAGDVEPLIPLQDELNTRLSDRAHRVTFQSFKMYLGRGIDNFDSRPVAPGRMWATDNPEASIEEFGGDATSPSEAAHIQELREAMDKISGVTPLAAGLLRDRVGNLSSAAALRVVLMGTLSRLERKRVTYGEGLVRLNTMLLDLLDRSGIFSTQPDERNTRLVWPNPLPENRREQLEEARLKLEIGVARADVLRELGYLKMETQA